MTTSRQKKKSHCCRCATTIHNLLIPFTVFSSLLSLVIISIVWYTDISISSSSSKSYDDDVDYYGQQETATTATRLDDVDTKGGVGNNDDAWYNNDPDDTTTTTTTTFSRSSSKSNIDTTSSFSCLDDDDDDDDPTTGQRPVPVILMSLGRSGSASTWQVISSLMKGGGGSSAAQHDEEQDEKAEELTGSNTKESQRFFSLMSRSNKTNYGKWVYLYMCLEKQKQQLKKKKATAVVPGANDDNNNRTTNNNGMASQSSGIIGFKWKPYWELFEKEPEVNRTLLQLHIMNSGTTTSSSIRIVRNRRNRFDVYLSRLKHSKKKKKMELQQQQQQQQRKKNKIPAHCYVGDVECLKRHEKATTSIEVPTVDLYNQLKLLQQNEDNVDEILRQYGNIPTIFVSYDNLYFPNTPKVGEEEWNKILRFLSLGRRHDTTTHYYTWKEIQEHFQHVSTTPTRYHDMLISNYQDVIAALNQTDLFHLLRLSNNNNKNESLL